MSEKYIVTRPWVGKRECPLYRVTRETDTRFYVERISGQGFEYGRRAEPYIHREDAKVITDPKNIEAYRNAWVRRGKLMDSANIQRARAIIEADEEFESEVADL